MSASNLLPVLTPSLLTAGKEQTVVVEFPRELPRDVLVTFDFYYENSFKKIAAVPTVILGPRTVKANFIDFPRPGEVEVVLKIAHEESTLFPKFKVHVQSPIEAIFHGIPPAPRGTNQAAILCSVLTYLMNTEDELKDKHMRSHADVILCNILQAMPEIGHVDWRLSALLCGSYGAEENLLHFCIRRRLTGMAEFLLQPKLISGRTQLLQSRAHDGKTPAELARKSGMKRVHELVEKSQVDAGEITDPQARSLTPIPDDVHSRRKPKSGNRRRANTHLDEGPVDVGPLPLFIPKEGRKKKKGVAKRLKSVFKGDNKDKTSVVISSPYPPPPVEYDLETGAREADQLMSPLSRERHGSLSNSASRLDSTGASPHLRIGADLRDESRRSWPRIDYSFAESRQDSTEGSADSPRSSLTHRMAIRSSMYTTSGIPGSLSPPTANTRPSSLPATDTPSLANAISELQKKSLYAARVIKFHRWASGPHGTIILNEGDVVYVTQELDQQTCLGVCHDCYGKFPRSILRPLTAEEREQMSDESGEGESDPYDEVDDLRAAYSAPRNVPMISSSDSDSDPDHLYDVPTAHDDLLRLHPNLRNLPPDHYRVPRRHKVPLKKPPTSITARGPALGRLLSKYRTSSSHDTGLDRLGLAAPHEEDALEQSDTLEPASCPSTHDGHNPYNYPATKRSPSLPRSMRLENPSVQRCRQLSTQSDLNLLESREEESGGDDLQRWDSCEITELRLSGDKTESEGESDIYDDLVTVTKGNTSTGSEVLQTEDKTTGGTKYTLDDITPQSDLLQSSTPTVAPGTENAKLEESPELNSVERPPLPLGPKPQLSTEKADGDDQIPTECTTAASACDMMESPTPDHLDMDPSPSEPPSRALNPEPPSTALISESGRKLPPVGPKPNWTMDTAAPPSTDVKHPPLPPKPKPRRNLHGTANSPPTSPQISSGRTQTMREATQRTDSFPPMVPVRPVPTIRKGLSERKSVSPTVIKKPPPVSPKPLRKLNSLQ